MSEFTPFERRELNLKIACFLGFLLEQVGDYFHLVRPDGSKVLYADGRTPIDFLNELSAWEAAGDWSRNVGEALELFASLPLEYTPRLVRVLTPDGDKMSTRWKAAIIHNTHLRNEEDEAAYSQKPEIAICLAWLMWKTNVGKK